MRRPLTRAERRRRKYNAQIIYDVADPPKRKQEHALRHDMADPNEGARVDVTVHPIPPAPLVSAARRRRAEEQRRREAELAAIARRKTELEAIAARQQKPRKET